MAEKLRIALLLGGDSPEREVSFASAASILPALEELGHDIHLIDPARPGDTQVALRRGLSACGIGAEPVLSSKLEEDTKAGFIHALELWRSYGGGMVFNALHGGEGEDGTVQALLEFLGIPYTGSSALACALSMNKEYARRLVAATGVQVTPGFAAETSRDPVEKLADKIEQELGLPVVVKPVAQGSSVGFHLVKSRRDLAEAVEGVSAFGSRFLVEKYIAGSEVTAAVLGREALPLVEIRPRLGVYDYRHKYTSGACEYLVPAPLADELAARVQRAAVRAFAAMGCSVYGRVDFRVSPQGEAYFLEVNTLPGMTAQSLVPKAARAAGISFVQLVESIIDLSLSRFEGAGSRVEAESGNGGEADGT